MSRRARHALALVGFVSVSQLAGLIGLPFNRGDNQRWYESLDRPGFTPPDALFGPVWTTLYLLMGVAAWLVWRQAHPARRTALLLFFVQLVVNTAWSPVFFGAHLLVVSSIVIVTLLLLIVATMRTFAEVRPLAAALLAPYLAWVAFATALNVTIAAMNP